MSLTSVDPQSRKRCYSASGYYQPAASRPNLIILTEAFVEELSIEDVGEELVAQGARFSYYGSQHYAKATKEVIVCAGSVQSPHSRYPELGIHPFPKQQVSKPSSRIRMLERISKTT
jgi:hypothetical protein